MQDPEQFQASVRWWAIERSGCDVEWEDNDPEALFVELVNDYATRANRILLMNCCPGRLLDDCSTWDTANSPADVHGEYDLICTCTGSPAFADYRRILAEGGVLIGIACAETHYIEAQEIFGRVVGWPPRRPLRFAIPEAVAAGGLQLTLFVEYFGTSFCLDAQAFTRFLDASAIIPDFDASKDAAFVREVQRKLMSEHGIRNTEHLAIYAASKRI